MTSALFHITVTVYGLIEEKNVFLARETVRLGRQRQ